MSTAHKKTVLPVGETWPVLNNDIKVIQPCQKPVASKLLEDCRCSVGTLNPKQKARFEKKTKIQNKHFDFENKLPGFILQSREELGLPDSSGIPSPIKHSCYFVWYRWKFSARNGRSSSRYFVRQRKKFLQAVKNSP
jgi:hypothetical protein